MNTTVVAGLAIITFPLSACGSMGAGLSSIAEPTTAATVTDVPGSASVNPAPASAALQPADSAVSIQQWVGGPDGTGLFAIGAHPRDGLVAIPFGRYEVKVVPPARGGDWMLCEEALCGPAYQNNATVIGHAVAPYSSTIYIGPKSRALWIDNLILSPADAPAVRTDAG